MMENKRDHKNTIRLSKFLFIGFFFLLLCGKSLAQTDPIVTFHNAPDGVQTADTSKKSVKNPKTEEFLKHLSVGGGFGLGVSNFIQISVKPEVAYNFLKNWMAFGVGLEYSFEYWTYYKISDHLFGAKIFYEIHLFNYVGLRAQYRILNFKEYYTRGNQPIAGDRLWANTVGVGGGFYRKFGQWATHIYIMYNFADHDIFKGLEYSAGFHYFIR